MQTTLLRPVKVTLEKTWATLLHNMEFKKSKIWLRNKLLLSETDQLKIKKEVHTVYIVKCVNNFQFHCFVMHKVDRR